MHNPCCLPVARLISSRTFQHNIVHVVQDICWPVQLEDLAPRRHRLPRELGGPVLDTMSMAQCWIRQHKRLYEQYQIERKATKKAREYEFVPCELKGSEDADSVSTGAKQGTKARPPT